MGRPKREVPEEDVLGAVTLNLKKRNARVLDRLQAQMGMSSRSAASTRLLDAIENMLDTGKLTVEAIAVESLPRT